MRSRARVSVVRVCKAEREEENCNYNLKNNGDYLCQKGKVVTQYFTISLKCQVVTQKHSLPWSSAKALKLHTHPDIPGEAILIVHVLSKHSSIMVSDLAINTASLIHIFSTKPIIHHLPVHDICETSACNNQASQCFF